jgi:hypothetical protein
MTKTKNTVARPTQYRKTWFRSKSEAVLARCLDLAGIAWVYEPFDGRDDAPGLHQWDFLVNVPSLVSPVTTTRNGPNSVTHVFHGSGTWLEYEGWFIEYKPSRPTDCYLSWLQTNLEDWEGTCYPGNFAVLYGNPWDQASYTLVPLFRNAKPVPDRLKVDCALPYQMFCECIAQHMTAARKYRYDICGMAASDLIGHYIY